MMVVDDDPAPLTDDELAAVAVFPLPRLVFFPHTALPLHLFEPRYQRMIEDCMKKGPGALVVTMLAPGHDAEYHAQPPMKKVACVGRVVAHERINDGRHNIVLSGMSRVRLEELPMGDLPYRRATAHRLEDIGTGSGRDVAALLACASPIIAAVQREHPEFSIDMSADTPAGQLADILADRLIADPNVRQEVLETLEVSTRCDKMVGALSELMALLLHNEDGSNTMLS
ncbi:MAG: LON peptidase substrate-binding domain-containing protein [Myxococcota bacterium]